MKKLSFEDGHIVLRNLDGMSKSSIFENKKFKQITILKNEV